MKTMSASSITAASDGAGSNVWLFVPSGTMPTMRTCAPATFSTMFVIGDTVVTTFRRVSDARSAAGGPSSPHAASPSAIVARARKPRIQPRRASRMSAS
jgi:hypothetical protein